MLLAASAALAQVELVDPDAPALRTPQKKPIEAVDPVEEPDDEDTPTGTTTPKFGTVPSPAKKPDAGVPAKDPKAAVVPAAKPERPPPPPIDAREISDADLELREVLGHALAQGHPDSCCTFGQHD